MVFISWYIKSFKEKRHDIILSNYPVEENQLLAIAFSKLLICILWLRHKIEEDMAGEQVMFLE